MLDPSFQALVRKLWPKHRPDFAPPPMGSSDLEMIRRRKWREGRKERQKQRPAGLSLQYAVEQNLEEPIALSPDGYLLTSGANDSTVRLWNPQTGREIRRLKAHTNLVSSAAWSRDGLLVSGANDTTVRLWNPQTGELLRTLAGHSSTVNTVSWSPQGHLLASGADDKTVRLWNPETGELLRTLTGHPKGIRSIAWSPDGRLLASGGLGGWIRLWNSQTGELLRMIEAHANGVRSLAWSPDGYPLASGGNDAAVRLWDPQTGREMRRLEGHSGAITGVSFSHDGRLLVSQSTGDGADVRFWRTDTWELTATLPISPFKDSFPLAFQFNTPILLTGSDNDFEVRIWHVDVEGLMQGIQSSMQYTNAKVVLMGDSGVGKSGLGLVLGGKEFKATESTHGRHVWTFDDQVVSVNEQGQLDKQGRLQEQRETLLWDLAGQPAYRIIHQLHLNEVTVALVVFDGRSETNPFAGVHHWDRALRQAQAIQGNAALPLKKILVAARVDRGGIGVGHERIESLVKELGFDGYIETSAKEGRNIDTLIATIKQAIEWDALPRVTSNELFQQIQAFLIQKKEVGQILSTCDELYHSMLSTHKVGTDSDESHAQFERCIDLVESRDLIRRLSFGNLILLQPELLDAYASALVNAVREEPDGLGSILEERVKVGDFMIPAAERLKDREQERLLLLAMTEDMLRHELALREQTGSGQFLVFPSQSTRVNPALPDPEGKTVTFSFEGPVQNIYATLAVRLSRSEQFDKKELWKDAITYTARVSGLCGMFLRNIGEGQGELLLFFGKETTEETRFHFEEYVALHLQRRAIPGTIQRRHLFTCPNAQCGVALSSEVVQGRLKLGFDWLNCPVCETRVELHDRKQQPTSVPSPRILEMDNAADSQRNLDALKSTIQGWRATKDFDVFLCHNEQDKEFVKQIAEQLIKMGLLPWVDEWETQPGRLWQKALEDQIEHIHSVAVFVGKDGIGPWQNMELHAFLSEFINRGCSVIPVILPDCEHVPPLPIFLKSMRWVDFRKPDPDPIKWLVWGITGKNPSRVSS